MNGRLALLARGLMLLSAVVSLGCKKDFPNELGEREPLSKSNTAKSAPAPFMAPYLKESLDDPALQEEARLQFLWTPPDRQRPWAFSAALDGTDLRLVADDTLLYRSDEESITRTPARSPDGRYLALHTSDMGDGHVRKRLVDLRAGTSIELTRGVGSPNFQWTQDSSQLYFYSDANLFRYDVAKKQKISLPFIQAKNLRLLTSPPQLFAVTDNEWQWYDLEGKRLKSQPFESRDRWLRGVSGDGRTIVYNELGPNYSIRSVRTPDPPRHNLEMAIKGAVFDHGHRAFWAATARGIYRIDSQTGAAKLVLRPPKGRMSELTMTIPPSLLSPHDTDRERNRSQIASGPSDANLR